MLSEREMRYRMKCALDQGIPFTNYGVAIACMNGILPRSLAPFPALLRLLDENVNKLPDWADQSGMFVWTFSHLAGSVSPGILDQRN